MVVLEDYWKVPTKMIGTVLFGGENAGKLSFHLFRFRSTLEVQIFSRDNPQKSGSGCLGLVKRICPSYRVQEHQEKKLM